MNEIATDRIEPVPSVPNSIHPFKDPELAEIAPTGHFCLKCERRHERPELNRYNVTVTKHTYKVLVLLIAKTLTHIRVLTLLQRSSGFTNIGVKGSLIDKNDPKGVAVNLIVAAQRELCEEAGLEICLLDLIKMCYYNGRSPFKTRIFVLPISEQCMTPKDTKEIASTKWVSLMDLLNQIKSHPNMVSKATHNLLPYIVDDIKAAIRGDPHVDEVCEFLLISHL